MTKTRILLATLLCLGSAFGQEPRPDNIIGVPPDELGVAGFLLGGIPLGGIEALQEALSLNERQIERLSEINFALEDETFPLAREAFEKNWELRRALRATPPNEAVFLMIGADLKRIDEQVRSVTAEHREMARAILSVQQIAVLGRLEAALGLLRAAQEAVRVNLIAGPGGYPAGPLTLGLFGLGGFGLIGGLLGPFDEQSNPPAMDWGMVGGGR